MLRPCRLEDIGPQVAPLLIRGENLLAPFKAVRDFVVFTDKRLIAVIVQGMTGKKRNFTSAVQPDPGVLDRDGRNLRPPR